MNMHWIDWSILAGLVVALTIIALVTRRYTRTVADFLAANRCGKRYLLTMAQGMAGMGAVTILGNFEKHFRAGFGGKWWGQMLAPITLVIALSGWVIYRFRSTRALTMAQFFEMRYSRRFRIFAGILCWVSGIINYGIFPGVLARFVVYFCGLRPDIPIGLDINLYFVTWHIAAIPTFVPIMAVLLTIAVSLALAGGQIAIMVTLSEHK